MLGSSWLACPEARGLESLASSAFPPRAAAAAAASAAAVGVAIAFATSNRLLLLPLLL